MQSGSLSEQQLKAFDEDMEEQQALTELGDDLLSQVCGGMEGTP